ncbi:MAG: DUF3021 family protein [Clostridia bacterium]|nr:DUF3021 family protein [Clostridia bacterium]
MKKSSSALSFFLSKFLFPATGIFTLLTLLFSLSFNTRGLTREKIWVIAFLAFGIAASNCICYIKKFSLYFKVATHFIALSGVLLATMYMTGYMKTGSWVVVLVAFVLLYALICPVFIIRELRKKRKEKEQKSYISIYDNIKK